MTYYLFTLLFIFSEHIPPLNERVIQFVDANKGKKVGEGTCWDLAAEALEFAGAYFDRSTKQSIYIFGKAVNPRKGPVFPGDIIQFENVEIQYKKGHGYYFERMPHHTAIIYKVKGRGQYLIAHQNSSITGKKVGFSDLDLKNIVKGKYFIYRPVLVE